MAHISLFVAREEYLVKGKLKLSDTFVRKLCYMADSFRAGLRVFAAPGGRRCPYIVYIIPNFARLFNINLI